MYRHAAIIDIQLVADAHGASEAALFSGDPESMIGADLFELFRVNPVNAGIAHMEQVRRS